MRNIIYNSIQPLNTPAPTQVVTAIFSYVTGRFLSLQTAALACGINVSEMIESMNDVSVMNHVDMCLEVAKAEGIEVELNALKSLDLAIDSVKELITDPECPPTAVVQGAQFLYRVSGIEQNRGYENKDRLASSDGSNGNKFSINIVLPEVNGGGHAINTI